LTTVAVTGATGFVGVHCIANLLGRGYDVRGTIRSQARAGDVEAMLQRSRTERAGSLRLLEADLTSDAGWNDVMEGCNYVLHVASPFPAQKPEDPEELIRPARDGTLRVLRASIAAGVKRVVLTSSVAAVSYGHKVEGRPYDERDWTNLSSPEADPYTQSKTLAELAAWDLIAQGNTAMELTTIAPVGIYGPVLGEPLSTSISLIRYLLAGYMPVVPRIYFGVVDIRDLADLHVRAMLSDQAAGERFIATAGGDFSILELADILREAFPDFRDRLPTGTMPDEQAPPLMAPQIGIRRDTTSDKAKRLLDWHPRSTQEAIIATAQSLIDLGLVD
jgi:dihydroflavonol-4-reductase